MGYGTWPLHGFQAHRICFVHAYLYLARVVHCSRWSLLGQHLHQSTAIYEARDEASTSTSFQHYVD
jgi:hypothetical protein